jgi:hypothetical protein
MRFSGLFSAVLALCFFACGGDGIQPDHQAEWRGVLEQKKAASSPSATPEHKQVYADAVRGFVAKHPNHGRAREVWEKIELQFASDLVSLARYQDAVRLYRVILSHDPGNEQAQRGLSIAVERLAVGREKLLALQKGMTQHQVASLLGKPIPGWTVRSRRADTTIDAWYYQTREGGVAAVYFRDGKVFAAEQSSNAQLARLGS